MINAEKVPCVLSHLGLECPASSATEVLKPAGKAPSIQDLIGVHVPLKVGTAVRAEVEDRICPGITEHEEMLDDSEDEKPGSVRITVTRKNWGTYLVLLYAEGVSGPVLRMDGARLKGKPAVAVYKGVPPVLDLTLRGLLTDGEGNTGDDVRRRWVHSALFLTIAEQQRGVTDAEEAELDEAAGAAAPTPQPVAGSTEVGNRPDALPEHTFTSEFTKAACAEMEKVHPGFTWLAIQVRQKESPGAPVHLGWKHLTAAASAKQDVVGLKEIRARVEQGG